VPHGIAVALGLQASLEWSMAGDPARYAAVAPAFGVAEDEPHALVRAFDEWLEALDFPAAARPALPGTLDAAALAREMANPANQPMSRNNARPAAEADLDPLAERVATCWSACLGPEARQA
jgi:alcohol dehydrogenase class IV